MAQVHAKTGKREWRFNIGGPSVLKAALGILALMCWMLAAGATAGAQIYLDKIGGPGGGSFDDSCRPGQNLAGFELRTADDVDAIRPVCVVTYGAEDIVPKAAGDSQWHGGSGGGQAHMLLCPPRIPVVLGMDIYAEGQDTIVVNDIYLHCGKAIGSLQSTTTEPNAMFEGPSYHMKGGLFTGADPTPHQSGSQRCPAGQVAVGMHGRSGIWVDAIGLICDQPQLTARPGGSSPPVGSMGRVPVAPSTQTPVSSMGRVPVRPATTAVTSDGRAAQQPVARAPIPICDHARDARARNSGATANLEAQCRAAGGNPALPGGVGNISLNPQPLPPKR